MTLGLGVMLEMLSGRDNKNVTEALGKTIKSMSLEGDSDLEIHLENGKTLHISDVGQSCCERRYMRTDDKLSDFDGAVLNSIELRDAESSPEDRYRKHEIQFLIVKTSKGDATFSNHNEHNGYYGGFAIRASLR